MNRTYGLAILAIIVLSTVVGCSKTSELAPQRKWLAERTADYIGVYKVAYEKVSSMQSGQHPCTKGHKAEEAALFHAVLHNLSASYTVYIEDIKSHLGVVLQKDNLCRDLKMEVDGLSSPFSNKSKLGSCGKLDATAAKTSFYLQSPSSLSASVARFKQRLEQP